MFSSFLLARFFGIKLYVQWITILMIAVLFYLNREQGMYILVGLLSIIPHEYGHALVARRMGNKIGDILITPLGGMANVSLRPFDPTNELFVTLAGPAVNCVIFLLSVIGLFVCENLAVRSALICVASVNLIIVIFNLLPMFPLDGGRIFRASLAYFIKEPMATQIACSVSMLMCIALGSFGIFSGSPLTVIMAVFIFFLSKVEHEMMCKAVAERDLND